MSNRSAKFVSALFASILAGANLATVTDLHAQAAADKCLLAPKGAAPAGSHWYYRIDHAAKRQCWYIREESDKTAPAASQESSAASAPSLAAADPVPPRQRATGRKSIADAHAELTLPQAQVGQDSSAFVEPRTVGAAPAGTIPNRPRATAPNAAAPSSSQAVRWPDPSAVSSSNNLRIAAAEPPPGLLAQSLKTQGLQTQAEPQPVTALGALANADSPIEKRTASMQMLLLAMAGALALAGIAARLAFMVGRARRRRAIRNDRRAIWDSIHAERKPYAERKAPSMLPSENVPTWRNEVSHHPRAPADPDRRVMERLSRLARSAQQ